MKKLIGVFLLVVSPCAFGQSVVQSGTVTPGHAVRWVTNGIVGDAGTAANGFLTSLGVTNNGGPGICLNSAPITGPYNQICLQATTNSGTVISSYAYGGATSPGISFDINGSLQGFLTATLPVTANDAACFDGTTGNIKDCGGAFTGFANPTALVGLTTVNGSATTAMRSDASPRLDVSISPTWTGTHTFSVSPLVPTPAANDSSLKAASTAFVQNAVSAVTPQQYGAVGNGIANDTAAVAAWLGAANIGKNLTCIPGSNYLTDPVTINSSNSPSSITCYGASFTQRSGASPFWTIENPQNATGYTNLVIQGLNLDLNAVGTNGIKIHGWQPVTSPGLKTPGVLRDVVIKNATSDGMYVLGEPSYGVYSNEFSNIHSEVSGGYGFKAISINNSGNNYVASNQWNNTHADGNTGGGYYLDYDEDTFVNPRAEGSTGGAGVSINDALGVRFVGGHMENNLLAAVDTSFAGTSNSLNVKILGTNVSGLVTGLAGNRGNTIDVTCPNGACTTGVDDGFNAPVYLGKAIGLSSDAPSGGIRINNGIGATTGNGDGLFGAAAVFGAIIGGQGSSYDFTLQNSAALRFVLTQPARLL